MFACGFVSLQLIFLTIRFYGFASFSLDYFLQLILGYFNISMICSICLKLKSDIEKSFPFRPNFWEHICMKFPSCDVLNWRNRFYKNIYLMLAIYAVTS